MVLCKAPFFITIIRAGLKIVPKPRPNPVIDRQLSEAFSMVSDPMDRNVAEK